ncbi:hypothetical protein BH11PSE12_BH11PSE12_24250 [soil metagenome]
MKRQLIAIGSATTFVLAACGGGSSSVDTPLPPAPVPTSIGTVINDGLIKGAIACLDMNLNGKCDTGEPTSDKSDINGKATITVPAAIDASKFPVVVEVPADAVDADNPNGTVGTAYTLSAPAGKAGYISPLTTMVQTYLAQNGGSADAAADAIKAQLKLVGSPLDNIVGKTDVDAIKAADAGRVLVKIKQAHLDDVKELLKDDPTLNKEQVDALLNKRLLELLSVLQEKLSSGKLSTADIAAAVAEIKVLTHIDKDSLKDALDDDKKHAKDTLDAVALPTAGATVRWFSYVNSTANISYFLRQFLVTDADVKDAATTGKYFYGEQRYQMTDNVKISSGSDWIRTDVYFTGAEWFSCPADYKNTATNRTAIGESISTYCNSYKIKTVRTGTDISGQVIKDVITDIRKFPYADPVYGSYKVWGADPATAGLDVKFSAGSKLFYYVSTDIDNPLVYSTLASDKVKQGAATGALPLASNLDTLITSFPGNLITDGTKVTSRNSLGIRTLAIGAAPDSITDTTGGTPGLISFQAKRRFSAAFDADGTKVRFYSCKVVLSDAVSGRYVVDSSYGCETLSDTTYKIETKADARVLSFTKMPDSLIPLWRNDRLLVERGASVMYGYRTRLDSSRELRLNGVAMDQIRSILNIN